MDTSPATALLRYCCCCCFYYYYFYNYNYNYNYSSSATTTPHSPVMDAAIACLPINFSRSAGAGEEGTAALAAEVPPVANGAEELVVLALVAAPLVVLVGALALAGAAAARGCWTGGAGGDASVSCACWL
jgi:hypothetical protein